MTRTSRLLVLLSAAVAILLFGYAPALGQTESANILGFEITFVGANYDAEADETTFTYVVKGTRAAPHDLSHFEIALCLPRHVVAKTKNGEYKTSHPSLTEIGTDPNSGVTGIKFDVEVDKSETKTFWFVLEGRWSVQDVQIAGKAATNVQHGVLAGPACDPIACEIHYSVEVNRIDLRVLRPGTYASILGKLTLWGTGSVTITFDEFGKPEYLASASSPPIHVEYSLGATVEEAERYGWRTTEQFNGLTLTFSESEIKGGVEVVIWVRYTVSPANQSSEYEGIGQVIIVPNCP